MEASNEKQKIKGFKMTENEVELVDQMLDGIEGKTNAEKLVNALKLANRVKREDDLLSELPIEFKNIFEGDIEKLKVGKSIIDGVFSDVLLTITRMIVEREQAARKNFEREVSILEKLSDNLELRVQELESHNESLISENSELSYQNHQLSEDADNLKNDLTTKLKYIEKIETQIEQLREEIKNTVGEMKREHKSVLDELKERLFIEEIEVDRLTKELSDGNKRGQLLLNEKDNLINEISKVNQVNQSLISEIKLKEVNLDNLNMKVDDLKLELQVERQAKSQLQSELIKFMSMLSSNGDKERELGKKLPKTEFRVIDQTKNVVVAGSRQKVVNYLNKIQKNEKVGTTTSLERIKELLFSMGLSLE